MSKYDHRLATLARTGRSARAVAKILRAEGHDVSDSTVGRRMAVVLGPQRVSSRARPSTRAPAHHEATDLVPRILLEWVAAQSDPQAAEERVHASLAEYGQAEAAGRGGASRAPRRPNPSTGESANPGDPSSNEEGRLIRAREQPIDISETP